MSRDAHMQLRADTALATVEHHTSMAAHHAKLADDALREYLMVLPVNGDFGSAKILKGSRKVPKCVQVWTEWMTENGPGTRQEVTDGSGMKFTERGTPFTVEWADDMVKFPDNHFPSDAIFRIRGLRDGGGRGGAPVIYFLWGQRWDLYKSHGVGPKTRVQPTEEPETEAMTGVLYPPVLLDTPVSGPEPEIEPRFDMPDGTEEEIEPRFASLDDWHERWNPLLETLAPHDAKPSEEEQAEMLATMPEGTSEPKAVMAVAYNQARRRATGLS